MVDPRISVICIFFNEEKYIAEAIESVLAQQFEDFELILVDDGSTDSSTRIAKEYAERYRGIISCIEHPGHANRGCSAARNLGLHSARGEFVTWLDGDDRFRPGKLAEQVALLDANAEVGMVCGGYVRWRSWRGGVDEVLLSGPRADRTSFPPETTLSVYPLGWSKNPTDPMVRREIALRVGGYEEEFRGLYEDQAFLSKIYLETGVLFARRIWLDYRDHPESCTAQVGWPDYFETHRRFLDWFEGYVAEHSVADKNRILRRIRTARRYSRNPWTYRACRKARLISLQCLRRIGFTDRYSRDRVTG